MKRKDRRAHSSCWLTLNSARRTLVAGYDTKPDPARPGRVSLHNSSQEDGESPPIVADRVTIPLMSDIPNVDPPGHFTRGLLGFARGFNAVRTVLGWLWLVGGVAGIVWGLVTWSGARAAGGFVGLVVGGFLVGLSAIGQTERPRPDGWARLRAAEGGSSALASSYQLRADDVPSLGGARAFDDPDDSTRGSVVRRLAHSLGCDGAGAMMDYRYTRHQVARGSRPDAISGSNAFLFKNVSMLRLTYQIRLLTFLAAEQGSRLVIRIPKSARMSRDLRAFVKENSGVLTIERVG